MKILIIIFATVVCTALFVFMHILADRRAKDLFQWGYFTGLIISFVLNIAFEII